MSYESYRGQSQQQAAYGQHNPYAEQSSGYPQQPSGYNQQSSGYSQQPSGYNQQSSGYSQQPSGYNQQSSGYARQPSGYAQQSSPYADVEQGAGSYQMTNMNGANSSDPNRILNECREVDRAIDIIETKLRNLSGLRERSLRESNGSSDAKLQKDIETESGQIMTQYRSLVDRVKRIKQNPESGNPRNAAQVGKVDRRTKTAINQFQQLDREYRQNSQAAFRRQYMIVRPDASEAEVREAMESPNQQIFSQALLNSDRRGEAQTTRANVANRHEQIQKIEQQMMELAQLFQDLEVLVVQQEPAVTQIEAKGEEVTDHVNKANTELTGAVKKARAARRKKWICLGICVAIIAVIIIIILVVLAVQKKL